jgi:hypothetical protein
LHAVVVMRVSTDAEHRDVAASRSRVRDSARQARGESRAPRPRRSRTDATVATTSAVSRREPHTLHADATVATASAVSRREPHSYVAGFSPRTCRVLRGVLEASRKRAVPRRWSPRRQWDARGVCTRRARRGTSPRATSRKCSAPPASTSLDASQCSSRVCARRPSTATSRLVGDVSATAPGRPEGSHEHRVGDGRAPTRQPPRPAVSERAGAGFDGRDRVFVECARCHWKRIATRESCWFDPCAVL